MKNYYRDSTFEGDGPLITPGGNPFNELTERESDLWSQLDKIAPGLDRVGFVRSQNKEDQIKLLTLPDVVRILAQGPEVYSDCAEARATVALIKEQSVDVQTRIIWAGSGGALDALLLHMQVDAVFDLIGNQPAEKQPFIAYQVIDKLAFYDPKKAFSLIQKQPIEKQAPLWMVAIPKLVRKDASRLGLAVPFLDVLAELPPEIQKKIIGVEGSEVAQTLANAAPKEFIDYLTTLSIKDRVKILNQHPSGNVFSGCYEKPKSILVSRGFQKEVAGLYLEEESPPNIRDKNDNNRTKKPIGDEYTPHN